MPGCPVCGGESRRPLAPTYWECTSQISESVFVGDQWLPVGPAGAMMPVPRQEMRTRDCLTRYHETVDEPSGPQLTCACGTFAIGACSDCSRPVCGDHSSLWDDRRVCVDCAATRQRQVDEIARATADDKTRQEAARTAERDREWAKLGSAEQFWVAMAQQRLVTVPSVGGASHVLSGPWFHSVHRLCPGFIGPAGEALYDSTAAGTWFAAHARRAGMAAVHFSVVVERKKLFGGFVAVPTPPVEAWMFPGAIEGHHRGERYIQDLYVLADGRLFAPRPQSGSSPSPSLQLRRLEPAVVARMAQALLLDRWPSPHVDKLLRADE